MSDLIRPSGVLIFPALKSRLAKQHIDLEERLNAWSRVVHNHRPVLEYRGIYLIAREITRQAYLLSSMGPMSAERIIEYLLTISLEWVVRDNLPPQNIMLKMPKNTRDLGLMVLAEGMNPHTGRKLDPREFSSIKPKRPRA